MRIPLNLERFRGENLSKNSNDRNYFLLIFTSLGLFSFNEAPSLLSSVFVCTYEKIKYVCYLSSFTGKRCTFYSILTIHLVNIQGVGVDKVSL